MSRSYKAVLRGNRLEWVGPPPDVKEPTPVSVTLGEDPAGESRRRGEAMAEALEELARAGGVTGIADPAVWQRELRQDRPVPGRED